MQSRSPPSCAQPGSREPGDKWLTVASAEAAADALGPEPRRVFLSLGRLELGAFATSPQHHYIARMIEPPEGIVLPRDIRLIFDRGPFDEQAETALLVDEKIDVMVSKNSGGAATYPKIAATRKLGIPVVMIARPHKSHGHAVENAEGAADMAGTTTRSSRHPRFRARRIDPGPMPAFGESAA